MNRYTYARNNPLFYADRDGQNPVVVVIGAVFLVAKVVDWGWTAWDAIQAARTMMNLCLPEEERLWAALSLALALGFESFEPDELLPAGLPLDDLARRALLQKLRQVWREEGPESVIRLLRKELGDEAAEKLLPHLDEVGVHLGSFDELEKLGVRMPLNRIVDDRTFVAWTEQLETLMRNDPTLVLTPEQADQLVVLARKHGVDVILDPPGHLDPDWSGAHLHFAPSGRRTHVRVPNNYVLQ